MNQCDEQEKQLLADGDNHSPWQSFNSHNTCTHVLVNCGLKVELILSSVFQTSCPCDLKLWNENAFLVSLQYS